MRAVQTVVLRQRTSARLRLQAGGAVHLGSCALLGLALPLSGPQAGLTFRSTPASRFRPAAAELTAEVGQMLAYVRIKQQASMTAFATQLTQITDALAPSDSTSSSGASSPQRCATPAAGQAPPAAPTLPKLQTALKVGQTAAARGGMAQQRAPPPPLPRPALACCRRHRAHSPFLPSRMPIQTRPWPCHPCSTRLPPAAGHHQRCGD